MEHIQLMTPKEVIRANIIDRVINKQQTGRSAAQELGISPRHFSRLKAAYLKSGPSALISNRRGKPSNHSMSTVEKSMIISLIEEKYHDFGPTLVHEKLTELHQVSRSVETIRSIMIHHGLWEAKSAKNKPVYQSRQRRSRFGELVQIDGSDHDWFEGRGDRCSLIVYIDDATSKLITAQFHESETTEAYFEATKAHINTYGRPCCYYSDKHSIFSINHSSAANKGNQTQFKRALKQLDIEIILAETPQAKGRVERANKTLQDRLVKELRLKGISNIESANQFLPEFIEQYNQKFGKSPRDPFDAHRQLNHSSEELTLVLSKHTQRKLSNALEIRYNNQLLQIDKGRHRLKGEIVTVVEQNNGEIKIIYHDQVIPFAHFVESDEPQQVADDKTINHLVDTLVKHQEPYKPKPDHPWRKLDIKSNPKPK